MSAVLQYALYPIFIIVPFLVIRALVAREGRLTTEMWTTFKLGLARVGLNVRPSSTPASYVVNGTYDELAFSIEIYKVKIDEKTTETRTAIRLTDTVAYDDAVISPVGRLDASELGAMQEVTFDRGFGESFRCFAQNKEQAFGWLTPGARALMQELGGIVELKVTDGAFFLSFGGIIAHAPDLIRAVELLAALHRQRAPRELPGGVVDFGFNSPWMRPLSRGPILAAVLAIVSPIFPPTQMLLSPITCLEGDLTMIWTSSGSGKSSGNLYCVDERGRKLGGAACFIPLLGMFNIVLIPATLYWAVGAARKEDEWRRTINES